jgi:SAM-dependent methyltransferase
MSGTDWLVDCSDAVRATLEAHIADEIGPEVALLRVLMAASSPLEADQMLARATLLAKAGADPDVVRRLEQLQSLAREHGEAWQLVATTLEIVDGTEASAAVELGRAEIAVEEMDSAVEGRLSRLATCFDRAAERCPEASVALYSLGEPSRLAAATAEIVQRLRDWGLLGHEWRYLDVGCGIGRIEQALWPEVGFITGIDISPRMIEIARARCAGAPNVAFRLANGRDLSGFIAGSLDVILAVDSFPYLVRCGSGLVEQHLFEAGRVLKPQGQMVIFNFSYGGNLASDRSELARLATRVGLTILRDGVRGLRTWDGAAYHLVKSG